MVEGADGLTKIGYTEYDLGYHLNEASRKLQEILELSNEKVK
jgi:hypothetical protein